jgi:uroporphyrin-3 C-methyltransferase
MTTPDAGTKMDALPAPSSPAAPARPRGSWPWVALLVLGVLTIAGWWYWNLRHRVVVETVDLSPEALDSRLLQAETGLSSLRRAQETQVQRLADNRARTDLLRDEVLGVSQRAGLLEDSVRELSDTRQDAAAALRLDEAELLLTIASERLRLGRDVAGAVHATELADGVLSALNDPALLNLRQSLSQELAALRALGPYPAAEAAGRLDALEAALPQLAAAGPARAAPAPTDPKAGGFERLLDALVQVRPSGEQDLLSPTDRGAGEAALHLELALARTALDRRDEKAFRASLVRLDSWIRRLYADGNLRRTQQAQIARLRAQPLTRELPVAGSTLVELRSLRQRRRIEQ